MSRHSYAVVLILTLCLFAEHATPLKHYTKHRMLELREDVRAMFQHAYDGYLRYAADYDELRPLSCDGHDTWGSYSLTLIDALDTLATMGNYSEFRRVTTLLEKKTNFDKDINVSVFETNIRIVGGLLSAHMLSKRADINVEMGWPCQGPLLRLAEDVARRLLPAFDTATGMPYGTVNLRYGVPKGETPITCTAGVGTFLIEFGTLSRLTGNSIYEEVALNAIYALWERRSPIGLFGNHIDVQTGRWTALDSGIGAGVDSFFEYLVKGALLLNRPDLLELFHKARMPIDKYLRKDDWYVWVSMNKGQMTLPVFQSLEAFWPGILSMVGDTRAAMQTMVKYGSVWKKYGFLPEFFNIPAGEAAVNRESYPLRPELIESAMYLYRATKNQYLLELGEHMLETIEHSAKTKCGYATIRNVVTHEKENRMESFFLAETTKYLYLLFDSENFLHNNGADGERLETPNGECVINAGAYIFNTEAHPMDMSALYCCHDINENIYEGLDLENYSDNILLKESREKMLATQEDKEQYQCSNRVSISPKSDATKSSTVSMAVDIEVFDEENNPAADILIENFERIKNDRNSVINSSDDLHKQLAQNRNQLTVTDLDEFFSESHPSRFNDNVSQTLEAVRNFMRNFTMDLAFIRGLQIFEKNLTNVLGNVVQKEFESRMRTLWELYDLEQRYVVNAQLVKALGLLHHEEHNQENLSRILNVLDQLENQSINALPTQNVDNNPESETIRAAINKALFAYQNALVNTTAMQQFLHKIYVSGTNEQKSQFNPLLNENEVLLLQTETTDLDAAFKRELFIYARRVVEFKKRMKETFDKLQTLMQETGTISNKQQQKSQAAETARELDITQQTTATTASVHENDSLEKVNIEKPAVEQTNKSPTTTEPESTDNDDDSNNNSMWSQLVQTILRKTNVSRTKFDEKLLLSNIRKSLHRYNAVHKNMSYELFSCQRPHFIETFAYREFYPAIID